jgi:flagellar M-ring protein FliF
MAETLPQAFGRPLYGFTALPLPKQAGFLAGVAVIVAIAVGMVTWAMRPTYQPLMPGLSETDKALAITALTRSGIPHQLDSASGMLMVPAAEMHQARLQLATEGLPKTGGVGFELLDQQAGIGTSRMVENTRYQRALEGELARSVTTLSGVESARVHLALPRQTVFVRDRVRPSASVLVNLHPGRTLDDVQIAGIVHLVASSVPELEPERVTVVDQRGRLLSQSDDSRGNGAPSRQLEYTQALEDSIRQRVRDILAPIVGEAGVRVQVSAEVDFTQVESTKESFDGDNLALRSEQLAEEENRSGRAGGVPGALSNQPPGAATIAPPDGVPAADGAAVASADGAVSVQQPVNRNSRSTRNYEVDRTVEHIKQAPASLSRLSVAVVVDDREVPGENGQPSRVPRTEEELAYLRGLVRDAIGVDEARGDRVTLVNASFREYQAEPEPEAIPLWEQPWFLDLVKQGLGALGVLILILAVLRPAFNKLAQAPRALGHAGGTGAAFREPLLPGSVGAVGPETQRLPAGGRAADPLGDDTVSIGARPMPEERLAHARAVAKEDPRVVAQVVRQWMGSDA